jgi:hypothetical protein
VEWFGSGWRQSDIFNDINFIESCIERWVVRKILIYKTLLILKNEGFCKRFF